MTELVWIEQEPQQGLERAVAPGTIGREGCDTVLPDPDVSRRHAVLRALDTGLAIEDLDSTNGTFVNDRRIGGITELRAGDRVRFGNTVWVLQGPAGSTRIADRPPAAPDATRAQPTDAPARAPVVPEPATSPAPQPAAAAAPAPAPPAPADGGGPRGEAGGRRGDVPAPDFAPSAIRRVLPAEPSAQPPQFGAGGSGAGRASAARRVEATLASYAIVIATAIAVVAYLAQR